MVSFPEFKRTDIATNFPEWFREDLSNYEWAMWSLQKDSTNYNFKQTLASCLEDFLPDVYDRMIEEVTAEGDYSNEKCFLWLLNTEYFSYTVGILRELVREELMDMEESLSMLFL